MLNDEVIQATDSHFEELNNSTYEVGITLEKRWMKCIEFSGDHVENKYIFIVYIITFSEPLKKPFEYSSYLN